MSNTFLKSAPVSDFAVMGRYMHTTPELEANVQKSAEALKAKYGKGEVELFFDTALRLGAINKILRDKAIENAEAFIASGKVRQPEFEKKLTEAANAVNLMLTNAGKLSNPVLVEIYIEMFDQSIIDIDRWQLWHLDEYYKCAGDDLTFCIFLDKLKEIGRDPIDWRPLVEMAAKVGPEKAKDVLEGKTPDSEAWVKKATKEFKLSAVRAKDIIHYLQTLANILAHKSVPLYPQGDKFATDGSRIYVPPHYGKFPTKAENRDAYTFSTYHEAGHISANSFVINAEDLDLSKAGYGFKSLGEEKDGIEVYKLDNPSNKLVVKTTMDLLGVMDEEDSRVMKIGVFQNPLLAKELLNIIEDRRDDARVMADNPGMADDYADQSNRLLQFRPIATDFANPMHVLEAFTQLVIIGKTREPMPKELEKVVMPLVERAWKVQLDYPDATESVHATIDVYNKLTEMFPILKTPRSIPLPEHWNEGEDHGSMSDPIIVQMEVPGEGSDGSDSGSAGIGGASFDKRSKENGKEKGKDKGSGSSGEEDDKGDKGKGSGGSAGEKDKNQEKDKGKDPGSGDKKGDKGSSGEGEKKKENGKNGGNPYGNPWERGKAAKRGITPAGEEFMPDWTKPGGGVKDVGGEYEYPQWDCQKGVYLPGWARVNEEHVDMLPSFKGKAKDVANVVNAVKIAFLRMKPSELRQITGRPEGEDIDFNRLLQHTIDAEFGVERPDDFYIIRRRLKRSVASAVLLDSSGSTSGQVIEVEKDALEVFAAANNAIGDPYALYAYNSEGRENTHFYIAKEFNEKAEGRPKFHANHANRDGVAIRHATEKLITRPEKRKILIIISDGKPNDDGTEYRNRYALEDTRKSVDEAVAKGVTVFCVAVRMSGEEEILQEMYGKGRVCMIDDVRKLPLFLPLLYRKLSGL